MLAVACLNTPTNNFILARVARQSRLFVPLPCHRVFILVSKLLLFVTRHANSKTPSIDELCSVEHRVAAVARKVLGVKSLAKRVNFVALDISLTRLTSCPKSFVVATFTIQIFSVSLARQVASKVWDFQH